MLIAEFVLSAPVVLLAALASAIPLVLHLLGRANAKTVEFPTMRFVRQAVLKTAYRRKIENLLLLLLRMGLFALLALALALPFYKNKSLSFGASGQTVMAIVLDNTASMQQNIKGKRAFDEAKLQAIRLVRGSEKIPVPQQAAVITPMGKFNRNPAITTNFPQLIEELRLMNPLDGEADLNASILRAEQILSDIPSANKLIYVITDMQKASLNLRQIENQKTTFPIVMLDVSAKQESADNIGIADVSFETPIIAGKPVTIIVRLEGKLKKSKNLNLIFSSLAGEVIESKQIFLSSKQNKFGPFTFEITIDKPGFYEGKIEVKLNDALSLDNHWYVVFKVNNPINVVVADDESTDNKPAFFVQAALQSAGWINLKDINTAGLTEQDLSDTQALYLCSPEKLSAGEIGAIKRFLKLGNRALIVFPNLENITAAKAILGELKLGSGNVVADLNEPVNVEQVNLSSRLVENLNLKSSIYRKLSVARYLKILPEVTVDSILILSGNDPLLIHGNYGGSDVYIFTTSAQVQKSNLPLNASFPAILTQIAGDTVPSGQDYIHRAGKNFAVKGEASTLSDSSGEKIRELAKGVSDIALYQTGIYEIKSDSGSKKIAINISPKAIDLTSYLADDHKQERDKTVFIGRSLADISEYLADISKGKPLWDYLLFTVILIMLGETLLANHRIK